MPQATAVGVNDEQATNLARAAITRFLEERPDFRDTKRNSIEDLVMFLEVEEDSAEWLPQFAGNTRSLSNLWHNLARNAPIQSESDLTLVSQPSGESPKIRSKRVSNRVAPVVNPKSVEVVAAPLSIEDTPIGTADIFIEKSDESNQELLPVEEELELVQTDPSLPESAIQTSRAIAEQFALVKYREQQLSQVNRSVEELNEALARAKQQQADVLQAYTHSLEELAQLLATSLGPKAGDFGKLFSRVVNAAGNR